MLFKKFLFLGSAEFCSGQWFQRSRPAPWLFIPWPMRYSMPPHIGILCHVYCNKAALDYFSNCFATLSQSVMILYAYAVDWTASRSLWGDIFIVVVCRSLSECQNFKVIWYTILAKKRLAQTIEATSDEWIIHAYRTGYLKEYIASISETTSDLSYKQPKACLETCWVTAVTRFNYVLVINSYPFSPSTASYIKLILGLKRGFWCSSCLYLICFTA